MSSTLARRAGLAALAVFVLVVPVSASADSRERGPLAAVPVKRACPVPAHPGQVTCLALVRTDVAPLHGIQPLKKPAGLGATEIRDAYRLPTSTGGTGATVAIINVYDDPKAEQDLATYRAQYGLPPCTTANGCFKQVNQNGQTTNLPREDTGWAQESAHDLDMASAMCPGCKLVRVEASSATLSILATAVRTAAAMPGVTVISNSYG